MFEVIAVSYAVQPSHYKLEGLEWLCLLNERDPLETRVMLKSLSSELRQRTPENGVNPDLPARCSAIVLGLTGFEDDENEAESLNPSLDRVWDYERGYLANPSKSFSLFSVRKKARNGSARRSDLRAIQRRIKRAQQFFLDPTFKPPRAFVDELSRATSEIETQMVDVSISHTMDDHVLEVNLPAIAATCSDQLNELVDKQLAVSM